ncbi:MAG: ATP-binding cassette domain-containing protein [Oligoflexia bacterium]|nr:ATP-binding cassette domain-containing protein [Oligoflexia bacterium]
MNSESILVRNLRKTFKLKLRDPGVIGAMRSLIKPLHREVPAVDGVSFTVKQGEIVAFVGPNGAGKSTTIKILTGILHPSSGEVSVLGLNPQSARGTLAYKIGTVFGQKAQLWLHLPPQDSFDLFARIYAVEQVQYRARLAYLVDALKVGELLNIPVRKLSLGERMRCEIVASLLHSPRVIFLDEPTIGLDVIAKQQIREVIRRLNREEDVTIFLTSHDAGDIEALAHRTIVINHGTLVLDESTENFKKRYVQTKTVELVLDQPAKDFCFPEGEVLERGDFHLKIEFKNSAQTLERLFRYALEHFTVRDINIYEPSMEEIIATIYRERRNRAGHL